MKHNTVEFLGLDYRNDDSIWLRHREPLQRLIGIAGMALPLLLYLFLLLHDGQTQELPSISHYYFTRASGVFIIVISILALFLILYTGYEPIDFYVSVISGFFALLLIILPTSNLSETWSDPSYVVTVVEESSFRSNLHFISAAIFLGGLAFMSIFLFTKSDKPPGARGRDKVLRNRICRVCGMLMIAAMLVILGGSMGWILQDGYDKLHMTFWMETVAVESFGVSWLVKARVFTQD